MLSLDFFGGCTPLSGVSSAVVRRGECVTLAPKTSASFSTAIGDFEREDWRRVTVVSVEEAFSTEILWAIGEALCTASSASTR